jgi:isocitrate dehydrogenase
MSDEAIRTVEDCGILFKGPMETPKGGGGKSINVTARKLWNAYANFRVFKTLPGVETVYSKAGINIDMSIVRENIEDTYGGVEHRLSNDMIQCKRLISAPGCDQVHRFAFQTARKLGIKKVHCGHKANIMKMTDGLFLDRFKAPARTSPRSSRRRHRRRPVHEPGRSSPAVPDDRSAQPPGRHRERPVRRPGRRPRVRTSANIGTTSRSSKPCTALRPTSPAAASPTRRRSCSRAS